MSGSTPLVWISGLDSRFIFQIWISGFGFPVEIPRCIFRVVDFKFGDQVLSFRIRLKVSAHEARGHRAPEAGKGS